MQRKTRTRTPQVLDPKPVLQRPVVPAAQAKRTALQRHLNAHTSRPARTQRQAVHPILTAARLHADTERDEHNARAALLARMDALHHALPDGALQAAQQRQVARRAPTARPARPTTPEDWVRVALHAAQHTQDPHHPERSRPLNAAEYTQHTATLHAATQHLVAAFRSDTAPAAVRHATYGERLATLQRHPGSAPISRMVLHLLPTSERPGVQRAMTAAVQRHAAEDTQDAQALELHDLHAHLAALDADHARPLTERIEARRGHGAPLPDDVRRHLELGLNADLSRVRVHTDTAAHTLSKSVHALAFTSGNDIFFRTGTYTPNTRSGLELLAHEVTHTVQQAQGRVTPGIDPDASLETEARDAGARLAQPFPHPRTLFAPPPHAPGVYTPAAALHRAQHGAVQAALHGPFRALQRHADPTVQRWNPLGAVLDKGRELIAQGLTVIPGYRELCAVFGRDLVTGKAMAQNPNAILTALTKFLPAPLRGIAEHLRESNAIPKAWAWLQGELAALNVGGLLPDIANALKSANLGKARDAVTARITRMRSIVSGSATKLAEIALDAVGAGLGPAARQVIAGLKRSGNVLLQVLKNPAAFARNLIQAVTGGFRAFGRSARTHLQNGLGTWLSGSSGFTFPAKLDVAGVFSTVLTVLGLTYQNFRAAMVRKLGREQTALAEQKVDLVRGIARKGLLFADDVKAHSGDVKSTVVDGVKDEVRNTVIVAATQKLVTMFVPGGGFVNALISAFDTVKFLMDKGRDIMAVVSTAVNSVGAIASGNISSAVSGIERSLAGSIPLALNFLSRLLRLGNIGGKVKGVMTRVKSKLDRARDKVMDKIAGLVAKIGKALPGGRTTKALPKGQSVTPDLAAKQKVLNAALTEAGALLSVQGTTPAAVKRALPGIQKRHGLKSLRLINEGGKRYHIHGKLNPEGDTPSVQLEGGPKPTYFVEDHYDFFHGTIEVFAENIRSGGIDLRYATRPMDFGKGFYVTFNKVHAEQMSGRTSKFRTAERDQGRNTYTNAQLAATVLHFKVNTREMLAYSGREFLEANDAWASFVEWHRADKEHHRYDFVYGPAAKTYKPDHDATKPMKFPKFNQISIHSPALAALFHKGLQ
ncbi:eCIS core domain-containing protein [Deinococcus maricopensis]|nr:DUF4157 domain-containing protein [Deinococcus maricopensis]